MVLTEALKGLLEDAAGVVGIEEGLLPVATEGDEVVLACGWYRFKLLGMEKSYFEGPTYPTHVDDEAVAMKGGTRSVGGAPGGLRGCGSCFRG